MSEARGDITRAGRVYALKNIVLQLIELKSKKDLHFCYKDRVIDGFFLGAIRSNFFKLKPNKTNYDSNSRNYTGFITLEELSDKDELSFILRIIGYSQKLRNADTSQKIQSSHEIIYNLKECKDIAENLFDKNFIIEDREKSFQKLIEEDRPDGQIYNEL